MAGLHHVLKAQIDVTEGRRQQIIEAVDARIAALGPDATPDQQLKAALTTEERAELDKIDADLPTLRADYERAITARDTRTPAAGAGVPVPTYTAGARDHLHLNAADKPWGYELGVRMVEGKDGIRTFGGRPRAAETALGACMQAIFRAGEGMEVDARLIQAASGGNTSDPHLGGFSVGTDISMFLFGMGEEASQLLPYTNRITISGTSDGIEAPYITNTSRATGSRFGGVRVYRRKEAATVTASQPEEEKFELRLADLMGIAYQTDRMLADAAAMGAIYATAFRNEFKFIIDNELVRGTGVGECQGVLASPALVTIAIQTGQTLADSAILSRNLSDMWVAMPTTSKANAVWFYNAELGPSLDELTLPVSLGALEPRFVNYGPDGILRIKGRPAIELEQASAPGTVGDIMLLDMGEYNVITKGALEQAESDHVRFLYGERTFRWTQRINGKSHWRSAVTPFNGSVSRSPFVTLNTRS